MELANFEPSPNVFVVNRLGVLKRLPEKRLIPLGVLIKLDLPRVPPTSRRLRMLWRKLMREEEGIRCTVILRASFDLSRRYTMA